MKDVPRHVKSLRKIVRPLLLSCYMDMVYMGQSGHILRGACKITSEREIPDFFKNLISPDR